MVWSYITKNGVVWLLSRYDCCLTLVLALKIRRVKRTCFDYQCNAEMWILEETLNCKILELFFGYLMLLLSFSGDSRMSSFWGGSVCPGLAATWCRKFIMGWEKPLVLPPAGSFPSSSRTVMLPKSFPRSWSSKAGITMACTLWRIWSARMPCKHAHSVG